MHTSDSCKSSLIPRALGILVALVGSTSVNGQGVTPNPREVCAPILAAAITSEINLTRSVFSKETTLAWLCSQTYTSEESASASGIDVSAIVDGVKVGFLYSSDQQKRSEARTKLCQGSTATVDSAYRLALSEVIRDPNAYKDYGACVSNVLQSQKDLVCYFEEDAHDAKSLSLNIIYRPAGARTGKFSGTPSLTGANYEGAGTLFDALKKTQRQPFSAARPVAAFTSSFPVSRPGVSAGSFNLNLDDGTSCRATFDRISASVEVQLTPVGNALSRDEGRHSYHVDRGRNCGDDNHVDSLLVQLPSTVVPVPQQDLLAQVNSPSSSNCGNGASLIRGVRALGGNQFAVDYNIVGCGYDIVRACKGKGWIDQYGFIRTKVIDTTKPQLASHTERKQFASGQIGIFRTSFKQGLEPDFQLLDYSFTAEVKLPDASSASGLRNFTLRGYASNTAAPGNKYCEEWRGPGGAWNSVTATIDGNGMVTIFQESASCENYKARAAKVSSDITSVSPDLACRNRRDNSKWLPKKDSSKLTPKDVFDKTTSCKP